MLKVQKLFKIALILSLNQFNGGCLMSLFRNFTFFLLFLPSIGIAYPLSLKAAKAPGGPNPWDQLCDPGRAPCWPRHRIIGEA